MVGRKTFSQRSPVNSPSITSHTCRSVSTAMPLLWAAARARKPSVRLPWKRTVGTGKARLRRTRKSLRQRPAAPARRPLSRRPILRRQEHRVDRPNETGASSAIAAVLRNPARYVSGDVDRLVSQLEEIVRESDDPSARRSAAWMLGLPGQRDVTTARPGTFNRLAALYEHVTDTVVKAVLLGAISRQVQAARAVSFLRDVVSSGVPSSGVVIEVLPTLPVVALNLLSEVEGGCIAVEELSVERRVNEPNARALLPEVLRRCAKAHGS